MPSQTWIETEYEPDSRCTPPRLAEREGGDPRQEGTLARDGASGLERMDLLFERHHPSTQQQPYRPITIRDHSLGSAHEQTT